MGLFRGYSQVNPARGHARKRPTLRGEGAGDESLSVSVYSGRLVPRTQPERLGTGAMTAATTVATRDLASMYGEMQCRLQRPYSTASAQRRTGTFDAGSPRATNPPGLINADWERFALPPSAGQRHPSKRGRRRRLAQLLIGGGITLFSRRGSRGHQPRPGPCAVGIVGPNFGLVLEVYALSGSFVSLVQGFADPDCEGLTTETYPLSASSLRITREQPIEIYARLNVQNMDPTMEQIVASVQLRRRSRRRRVRPLAYTENITRASGKKRGSTLKFSRTPK